MKDTKAVTEYTERMIWLRQCSHRESVRKKKSGGFLGQIQVTDNNSMEGPK